MLRQVHIGWWRGLLWMGCLLSSALMAEAQEMRVPYSAAAVKAAFLVNFARFSEWRQLAEASPETPLVIGVLDDREVENALWTLTSGQRVQGRTLRVKRVLSPADAIACQILYFGPLDEANRAEWLREVADRPVLTVSADPAFLAEGGLISFYNEGQNLRFEIEVKKVQDSQITLSSRLLALSRPRPQPSAAP